MSTLSVVLSVRNEEKKLARTLSSITWANEIIVVDSDSTDNTVKVARKFTDKIFSRPNNPMLNVNKNFGFNQATGDWILSLDGDEEVTPLLTREIQETIKDKKQKTKNEIVGYWITRKNIIFGKWIKHGLWWPDRQLRLFRRGRGKFPCRHVHEYLEVDGPTAELSEPYLHYNYETISQFIRKMETIYTESEVERLAASGYQVSWYDAIRFPISDFVKIYFAQRGYKDGLHGLVLSLLQSFYALIVFAKLWERQGFVERDVALAAITHELKRAGKEITYWNLSALINSTEGVLKQIWLKLKRRYVAKI